ncbi:MAG: stage II sporulation protein R [Bacillota bacterium]|nr:stage II sporulation protein R [Bacillota bacterium]
MKKIVILLMAMSIAMSFLYVYAESVKEDISSSLLRLHVLANSDTEEDQALKLKVRDRVLAQCQIILADCKTREDAEKVLLPNLDLLKDTAKDEILKNGYSYDVKVSLSDSQFPTKYYADISLPKGLYRALKVEIGNGAGHNWWCVVFPPLCFANGTTGVLSDDHTKELKDNLSDSEYDVITGQHEGKTTIKFKILELL